MFRLLFASCLLASLEAAPADEKKTVPVVANSFTATVVVTEPHNTPEGALGEIKLNIWFDGDEGNERQDAEGRDTRGEEFKVTEYSLKNLNGRSAEIGLGKETCWITYVDSAHYTLKNPLQLPEDSQFLGEVDMDGEKVEQWQYRSEEEPNLPATVNAYIKVEEGLVRPVRYEVYRHTPPDGSDMILPTVAEVKEFSASKPPASVFEFDASKCKQAPYKSFFSGINWF